MRSQMTKSSNAMTRDELQVEAQIVEALLDAATIMRAGATPEDAWALLEMASDRAQHLVCALDAVNA